MSLRRSDLVRGGMAVVSCRFVHSMSAQMCLNLHSLSEITIFVEIIKTVKYG